MTKRDHVLQAARSGLDQLGLGCLNIQMSQQGLDIHGFGGQPLLRTWCWCHQFMPVPSGPTPGHALTNIALTGFKGPSDEACKGRKSRGQKGRKWRAMQALSTTSNWDRFVQKQPFDGGCERSLNRGSSVFLALMGIQLHHSTVELLGGLWRLLNAIEKWSPLRDRQKPVANLTPGSRVHRLEETGSMQRLFLVCDSCRETTVRRHPWEAWSFAPSQSRALPAPWLGALVWTRAGPPKGP